MSNSDILHFRMSEYKAAGVTSRQQSSKKEKRGKMNSEKIIKKYIGAPAARKVFSWIFLLGLLATLPMWTIFRKEADPASAVQFDSVSHESGEYTYIDIVGVSDWFYKYTRRASSTYYHAAEDAEGYLYVIELTRSDYKKMTAQQEYWMRADDNAPMPEAYRVYGQAKTISSGNLSDFADAWEISTAEFTEHLGTMYLDVGSSDENNTNILWTSGSILTFVFFLALALENRKVKKNTNYCIDLLASKGELDAAAAELADASAVIIGNDMARTTANYLFGRKTGVVLRYDDIAYCYTGVKGSAKNMIGCFFVSTKDKKNIQAANLGRLNYNAYGGQLEAAVAEHNPNALVGNTQMNAAAYKEIYKANK